MMEESIRQNLSTHSNCSDFLAAFLEKAYGALFCPVRVVVQKNSSRFDAAFYQGVDYLNAVAMFKELDRAGKCRRIIHLRAKDQLGEPRGVLEIIESRAEAMSALKRNWTRSRKEDWIKANRLHESSPKLHVAEWQGYIRLLKNPFHVDSKFSA